MENSYAGKITQINTMINALKEVGEPIGHHLPANFLADMEKDYQAILTLDAEHEAAKSRVKETTIKMDEQLTKLVQKYRYARNIVKLELPQESWLAYGCKAKR